MRQVVAVLIAVAVLGPTAQAVGVPNCPDLEVLESDSEVSAETLRNLLLCFCKSLDKGKVAISCYFGSNLDHLKRSTDAVKNASLTTSHISIQHMEFGSEGLPKFGILAPSLESLDIRECPGREPLKIPNDAFVGVEQTLRNLTIHACNLPTIPEPLNTLENLDTLALPNNKLETLYVESFKNKKQLSYLDLSGNFINGAESEAFTPLTSLESLVIGEHNFMNESVLEEIGRLKALKFLDLTRADGIFEPPMSLFDDIPQLESLKLSGCSIASLEPGQFAVLKKLQELDLRVNLIENITAYAFDGLENLHRLSLAGNYIAKLEPEVFFGLSKINEIDLGWNEIKNVPETAFKPVVETLKILKMRHNPISSLPSTGLTKLEQLTLMECDFTEIDGNLLKDFPNLQELDIGLCKISKISEDAFEVQKDTLKKLDLRRNQLKTIPKDLLKNLAKLESLDVSKNPYLCDAELSNFIFAVEDRHHAVEQGTSNFTVLSSNETVCDRPYSMRDQPLLALDTNDLQPYDESIDTTTVAPKTESKAEAEAEVESATPLKIPDLFIGSETNETLFKEEPRRNVYDLSKTDDTKSVYNEKSSYALPITIGVIAIISIIIIVAVVLFLKKNRKIGADDVKKEESKSAKIEDGMVEIELDSNPASHNTSAGPR